MTKTFRVKNYKRVEDVEITSGAGLVILGGKNSQGKSSFLDGIREIVRFIGVRETPEPIRLGADEAETEIIDHDRDRRYVRTYKRAKSGKVSSTAAVYALDGAKYDNPAAVMAEDVGAEIIDAAAFAMLGPRDQRDTLLRQVELPFDLEALGRQKKGVEDERKVANAEVKRLTGALASLPAPAADVPEVEQSASELLNELSDAKDRNMVRLRAGLRVAELTDHIARAEEKLASLRAELPEAKAAAAVEVVDTTALAEKIASVEATNAAVRAGKQYRSTELELRVAEALSAAKQEKLDELDKKKRDALTAANFPDPLLSVDDEQVLYDGIPFSQVNSAMQIGIGFDVATLTKRDLKIGFLKNGDLLDDESLAEIEKRAVARDYTILVERGRSGEKGWVFNEGELV